jgi:hypothetical protein
MIILGEASSMGVFGKERGKPRVSFALNDKRFYTNDWFYTQHVVASGVTTFADGGDHVAREFAGIYQIDLRKCTR